MANQTVVAPKTKHVQFSLQRLPTTTPAQRLDDYDPLTDEHAEALADARAEQEARRAEQAKHIEHQRQDFPCQKVQECAEWQARRVDTLRKRLEGKHRLIVYRDIARRSANLTGQEFRMLDAALSFSRNLTNCFPSHRSLLQRMGGKVHTRRQVGKLMRSLQDKGWLVVWAFESGDDEIEVEYQKLKVPATSAGYYRRRVGGFETGTGRFISAKGYQFRIPANEIGPDEPAWEGPEGFKNRIYGANPNH